MSLLTSEQLKAATKYAKQDIKLLKNRGYMAITGTQKGVLMLEFENGLFEVYSYGEIILSTDCKKVLLNALINDFYIID